MGTDAQLQQAIQLIRAGQKHEARHELANLIRSDPNDAQAWYLLGLLLEDPQKRIDCLQRALVLNPRHARAKAHLERLIQIAVAPEPEPKADDNQETAPPVEPDATTKKTRQTPTQLSLWETALPRPPAAPAPLTEELTPPPLTDQEKVQKQVQEKRGSYLPATLPVRLPSSPRAAAASYDELARQLAGEPEGNTADSLDIVQLLVDDIARLPIITNPHQELCLGVELQAAPRLAALLANWKTQAHSTSYSLFLCQSLLQTWDLLEQHAVEQVLPLPRLEAWASELLAARRNVYTLRHSRIRRFIHRVRALSGKDEAAALLNLVYEAAETLAIFPGTTLAELARFIITHQRLPSAGEMVAWLPAIDLNLFEGQVKQRVKQTQKTLTTGYLRYALRVAQGYIGQGLGYADLVQAGFMGLMRAARKFDYRVQARFGVYATSWIWQGITRSIAIESNFIRIPAHLHEDLRKWKIACEQLDSGLLEPTRNPTILHRVGLLDEQQRAKVENAIKYNIPLPPELAEQYKKAIERARKWDSLQLESIPWDEGVVTVNGQPVGEDSVELLDVFPDQAPLPEAVVDEAIGSRIIAEQLWDLSDARAEKILSLRYGLQDGQDRTLKEVGYIFRLSRERIRQIEVAALERLANQQALGRFPGLNDLLIDSKPYALLLNGLQLVRDRKYRESRTADPDEANRLEMLLSQLPRSHWHQGQPGVQGGQRREQLVAALESLSAPAHVSDITEQVNGVVEGKDLDEAHVYNLLMRDEETFILLGQGVFSLTQWEQARSKEVRPVLTCCPQPLPDPPDFEDAFFESILVGQQALMQGLTAGQFVRHMLRWAQADTAQQNWFLQSVLSAYYLVDLIPYVFYFGGQNPVLSCMLPHGDIQDLRYHCLDALTQRLAAMPEFWWLLRQHQPIRPVDLGELFADVHPHGLDDVLQRLRLLAGLGAAQKLKYGAYRLTPLGETCANRWQKEAAVETTLEQTPHGSNTFADFVAWD